MFARHLIFFFELLIEFVPKIEGSLRGREILFGRTSGSRLYKTTTFLSVSMKLLAEGLKNSWYKSASLHLNLMDANYFLRKVKKDCDV